jgi:8-oxo-dGTP pyrophosphatase MutT (NUDIX family)
MNEQRDAWRKLAERTIYDSHWVKLGLIDVQTPSGEQIEHHVVRVPRIAIALIVNDVDQVLMLWRYRMLTEQWGYELLGGLVEDGEDPAATAAREALEESGWMPVGDPEKLISFEPLPGNITAPVDVFLWRYSQHIGEPTDPYEAGCVEWVPLARVIRLARQGELLGTGTLVPLLYLLAARGMSA